MLAEPDAPGIFGGMCGRFVLTLPSDAMAQLFAAVPSNDLPDVPNYNICPTDRVHAVVSDGDRKLQSLRWGLLPRWAKSISDAPPLINARAETVAVKPAFREAARQRRCLIPADGFFEWTRGEDGTRLPRFITRDDGQPMVFAGLWQDWSRGEDSVRSCAIVTCGAVGRLAGLHHRAPVVLEPGDWALWLGEEGKGAARLMASRDNLQMRRVGTAVNSNRAQGAELIEALE